MAMNSSQIHQGQPMIQRGELLANASAAMLMIHGRGGGAASILPLLTHLTVPEFAYLVPQAVDATWYPQRFLAPRSANQPHLDSALATMNDILRQIQEAGIPLEKTVILGFSQGACLALEVAARSPKRYGGVIAFSGGLIGADNELIGYPGSLENTPVFIGCSDIDTHIPEARVHKTAEILTQLGAQVDARIYPGMGHTVNQDEIDAARKLLEAVVS
jgi:predicted esterase